MSNEKDAASLVVLVILVLVIIALLPLGTIWAINTLFGLELAYTFSNWGAALILIMVFGSKASGK